MAVRLNRANMVCGTSPIAHQTSLKFDFSKILNSKFAFFKNLEYRSSHDMAHLQQLKPFGFSVQLKCKYTMRQKFSNFFNPNCFHDQICESFLYAFYRLCLTHFHFS